jgi:hypothetical protein
VVSDEQNLPPGSAVPTSAPASAAPASPASAAAAPRRGRRTLLVVVIAVAFLAVLGGTIGVVAYDKATAIDRSTPDVVVDQFLQAALVDRDAVRVGLFVCGRWPVADAMNATRLDARTELHVNWGITSLTRTGDQAVADVRVRLSVPAGNDALFRDVHSWRLTLVNEGGWRVCSVEIGPSINE